MPNLYNFFSPSKVVPLALGAGTALYPWDEAEAARILPHKARGQFFQPSGFGKDKTWAEWMKYQRQIKNKPKGDIRISSDPLIKNWYTVKTPKEEFHTMTVDFTDLREKYPYSDIYVDGKLESWSHASPSGQKFGSRDFESPSELSTSNVRDYYPTTLRDFRTAAALPASQYLDRGYNVGEAQPVGGVQQFFQTNPLGQAMTGLARSGAETFAGILNNLQTTVPPIANAPGMVGPQPGTRALQYLTAQGYIPPPTGSGYETLGSLFAPF